MLKLENKYDEINKTYFKKMKYVDWISWNRYNGEDDEMIIPFFVGTIVFFFMALVVSKIALVPAFFCLALFLGIFIKSVDEEYIELNSSYLVQLEGDVKPKYYSKWYLETTNAFEYEKNIITKRTIYRKLINSKTKDIKKQLPEGSKIIKEYVTIDNFGGYVISIEYSSPTSKFIRVERESDRKHWKNNIPENRILTWTEYKKYKKGKMKEQELLRQAEYIKEFKEYYGLEVKEIEEIVK